MTFLSHNPSHFAVNYDILALPVDMLVCKDLMLLNTSLEYTTKPIAHGQRDTKPSGYPPAAEHQCRLHCWLTDRRSNNLITRSQQLQSHDPTEGADTRQNH